MIWNLICDEFGVRPKKVVLLNSANEVFVQEEGFEFTVGDGRALPFEAKSFDLVFSNSVIEHVGSYDDMAAFAREIMRVGENIYVQTPNRWFPVEPHIVALFIHWLPRNLYHRLVFLSLVWWVLKNNREMFYRYLEGTDLLSKRQMRSLFPMKNFFAEKFFGLNKSFIVSSRGQSV